MVQGAGISVGVHTYNRWLEKKGAVQGKQNSKRAGARQETRGCKNLTLLEAGEKALASAKAEGLPAKKPRLLKGG